MPNSPKTIKSILIDGQLNSTRLWLALGSFIWAILLFWPGTLFVPSRVTYNLMAVVAREEIWGTAFLIQGSWALYTLLTGTRNRLTLFMDAVLGCVLWTSSTLLCFAAHWPPSPDNFCLQLTGYRPPAAMSGEILLSLASWWHLVIYWANTCNDKSGKSDNG